MKFILNRFGNLNLNLIKDTFQRGAIEQQNSALHLSRSIPQRSKNNQFIQHQRPIDYSLSHHIETSRSSIKRVKQFKQSDKCVVEHVECDQTTTNSEHKPGIESN